jgi:hypothetical protein
MESASGFTPQRAKTRLPCGTPDPRRARGMVDVAGAVPKTSTET